MYDLSKVVVTSSPHIKAADDTRSLMADVCLALLPALVVAVITFGPRALVLTVATVISCVFFEWLYNKLLHKPTSIGDLSAVVTGILLAFNVPVSAPIWMPVIGGAFSVIIVKMLFGGIGKNFMNPALAGRCFLLISFAGQMTQFYPDGVSGATPLAALKAGEAVDLMEMFVGMIPGTIGETSVIALLIGAAYLLAKKVINWRIPVIYIGSLAVFVLLLGGRGFDLGYVAAHIMGGGLIFGAFFMATDYVTSPITPVGQIIYGVCLGVLTGVFRIFGPAAEGVSYAIIFCNLLVPLIEKVTIPRPFGREARQNGKE